MKDGEVWGFSESELLSLLNGVGFRVRIHKTFSWGLNHLYVAEPIDGDLGSRKNQKTEITAQ